MFDASVSWVDHESEQWRLSLLEKYGTKDGSARGRAERIKMQLTS